RARARRPRGPSDAAASCRSARGRERGRSLRVQRQDPLLRRAFLHEQVLYAGLRAVTSEVNVCPVRLQHAGVTLVVQVTLDDTIEFDFELRLAQLHEALDTPIEVARHPVAATEQISR